MTRAPTRHARRVKKIFLQRVGPLAAKNSRAYDPQHETTCIASNGFDFFYWLRFIGTRPRGRKNHRLERGQRPHHGRIQSHPLGDFIGERTIQ